MVKRVWLAAKGVKNADYIKVLWPERYADLDESNVLERFRRVVEELRLEPNDIVIRLTADCPLLETDDIELALDSFARHKLSYWNNRQDGRDVQVFTVKYLFNEKFAHKEHVICDTPNIGGMSVNTPEDLEKVRAYVRR